MHVDQKVRSHTERRLGVSLPCPLCTSLRMAVGWGEAEADGARERALGLVHAAVSPSGFWSQVSQAQSAFEPLSPSPSHPNPSDAIQTPIPSSPDSIVPSALVSQPCPHSPPTHPDLRANASWDSVPQGPPTLPTSCLAPSGQP